MKVLAVDTSSVVATCAVLDDEKVLGEYSLDQNMMHSEKLIPMIKELMESLNLKMQDIDLFGAAVGPGSFTGLRIGLATMKSFAHVVDKPIVGVSTLEGLAYNLPFSNMVIPIMDARRKRVYTGLYKWDSGNLYNIKAPTVMNLDELIDIVNKNYEKVIFNGDGTLVYREELIDGLKTKALFPPKGFNFCRATSIGELALIKYKRCEVDDYFNLAPEYIRESQAQREYNKR